MIYASGIVKDGKLFIRFRRQFDAQLTRMNGGVEISISKGQRTLSQNRYYFGVVLPCFCEKTGYSVLEQDRVLEGLYAPIRTLKWRGRDIVVKKHCSELDKNEFSEFLERVFAEAAELGITIPEPEKKLLTDGNLRSEK